MSKGSRSGHRDRLTLTGGSVAIAFAGLVALDAAGAVDPGARGSVAALTIGLAAIVLAGLGGLARRQRKLVRVSPERGSDPPENSSSGGADRVIGGVAAWLGARYSVDPAIVRIALVIVAVASGGLVVAAYVAAWVWLARSRRSPARPGASRRAEAGIAVALAAIVILGAGLGGFPGGAVTWPLAIAVLGGGVLWGASRRAAEAESSTGEAPGLLHSGRELYRGGFGIALVLGAALLFLAGNDALGQAREVALATIVFGVAISLILAPFLWQLGRRLNAERTERIRSQERAEMSAQIHDSVLQTLALMRRQADDPRRVATLARRQERQLREWLSGERAQPDADRLTTALRDAAESIELDHGVEIEVVTVGDRDLGEPESALVAAAREALANAARHGGGLPVALFAEADEQGVEIFVRDRGAGFDLGSVPSDRRGVRDSIIGRMERAGGEAEIRSEEGFGTEVRMRLGGSGR